MKVLFIGGTGNISTAVSRTALARGIALWHLNRGLRGPLLGDKAHCLIFDNRKIKRLVPEFVARIPLHEGVQRALQWFDADPRRKVTRPDTHAMLDRIITAYETHRA